MRHMAAGVQTFAAGVLFLMFAAAPCAAAGLIVDHNDTGIASIPLSAITQAKDDLHIAYGHTSHGSQLTTSMTGLVGFANGGGKGMTHPTNTFAWNNGGTGGALDLHDYFQSGDLGNPDRTTWATRTRTYLNTPANSDVNVVIWSWCGQADTTAANIDLYLGLMTGLETDYPDVDFVYMTGHVNGCSTTGNLFYRNQQIRDYCTANNKILYDFADIESYDPDGLYVGDKLVTDACDYDSDGNGSRDRNWAIDWQNSHTVNVDWYDMATDPAHTKDLNGNLKAYAAWSLWTQIAVGALPVPGDCDGDGKVDGADLAVWQQHYDPLGTYSATNCWELGDWDQNGKIDGADLALWQQNYNPLGTTGMGGGPLGGLTEVPEPATMTLIALALGAAALIRRRRKV